jgi:hypothetical protein
VSERVFKVDWQTGKVLHEVQTESHNTSGVAVGGGYLWLGANGGVSGRRPPRPQDKPFGEIVQADIKTGKTIKVYRPPWLTGVHGITWVEQTQTLWSTALSINALAELDPKDNLRILRLIPVTGDRPHGLDWDNGKIWCLIAGDHVIQKLDPESGRSSSSSPCRAPRIRIRTACASTTATCTTATPASPRQAPAASRRRCAGSKWRDHDADKERKDRKGRKEERTCLAPSPHRAVLGPPILVADRRPRRAEGDSRELQINHRQPVRPRARGAHPGGH